MCALYRPRPAASADSLRIKVSLAPQTNNRTLDATHASLRPTTAALGIVTQAAGSASLECGATKVVASVYGPQELHTGSTTTEKGVLRCEARFAPFAKKGRYEDLTGRPEDSLEEELWLSEAVEKAVLPSVRLSTFPKSSVKVVVYVLEDGGGAVAAAITCASLALADSGIELCDLVAGCSVAVDEEGNLSLDPTLEGIQKSKSVLTLGVMVHKQKVTQFLAEGALTFGKIGEATSLGYAGCSKVAALMRDTLVDSFQLSE